MWRGTRERWRGIVARGDKSSEPRLNLSGSWQQGHSAAYNTPFLIQVVCKGFIGPGREIVIARGSGKKLPSLVASPGRWEAFLPAWILT